MVKFVNSLTARTVASLTKPGRHADGGGLYLRVDPSGAKRWVFLWERKIAAERVQREGGLGSVNAVPLAKAREKASTFRASLADGRDPLERRPAGIAVVEAPQDIRRRRGILPRG